METRLIVFASRSTEKSIIVSVRYPPSSVPAMRIVEQPFFRAPSPPSSDFGCFAQTKWKNPAPSASKITSTSKMRHPAPPFFFCVFSFRFRTRTGACSARSAIVSRRCCVSGSSPC